MGMLASRQASISRVPAGAVSFLPSTVKVTSAMVYCPFRRGSRVEIRGCPLKPKSGSHGALRVLLLISSGIGQGLLMEVGVGARFAVEMVFEFVAELVHESDGRHGRCVSQGTEGPAQHVLRQVTNVVDILGDAGSGVETGEGLLQPI